MLHGGMMEFAMAGVYCDQIYNILMNQELLDAIKKRKQKLGVDDPQPEKPQPTKQNNNQGHGENFNQNKKMLEDLFGGKKNVQEPVVVKKEEIKGDQAGFKNAKALLEQQFANKGGNTNALNVNSGGGLLPPPPLNSNPLPPPPPLFDLPPLPIPSLDLPPLPGDLPPPPSLNGLNLPPPPSLSNINLPPPPSLNNINLPPPPPFNPPAQQSSRLPPPPINLPPPPINLPPPPMNIPINNPPTIKIQPQNQNNYQNNHQSIKLPPPPIINNNLPPPPPINNNLPPPINLPPPPNNILPPPPNNNILPPPPNNIVPPQNPNRPSYHPQQQVPPKNNIPPPKVQDDEPCFILSGGVKPSVPVVTGWDKDELEKSKKKRIFDKKSEKKYPITEEFFGKNLGALIKQEFLRTVNIIDVIDKEVKKETYEFHFPSIENKIRSIEAIQTLYADTITLDLVSCYMTMNLNAAKVHNQQRDQFVAQLRSYNWEADPLKWKAIRESAAQIPNSKYVEPNFVQIKNAFKRIDNVLNSLAQQKDFAKCTEVQGLKVETENMLKAYLAHPTSNPTLIERIDENVSRMKNLQV